MLKSGPHGAARSSEENLGREEEDLHHHASILERAGDSMSKISAGVIGDRLCGKGAHIVHVQYAIGNRDEYGGSTYVYLQQ